MPRYQHSFTAEERRRSVASRLGLPLAEYDQLRARGLKRCWACRRWRPKAHFGANRASHDGRQSRCRSCRHVAHRRARGVTR